jgi:glutamyl-tRNA synthetase
MQKDNNNKIRVRFAPSPTGLFHVGSARVALFNYLFARQNKGAFVLRIEDTDKERSKPEYEKDILDGMTWLGLDHDEQYKQSERTAIYKKYLEQLIKEDKAYISKEEPKEAGERSEVIRFRNPNKKVTFNDLIRGEIAFDTTELGDFVIAKSIDEPIFHFVVVVDDFEMHITHIIRGEDHISNTPRHILIQEALGAPTPIYAHLPLILDEKRAKLSKRVHGEKTSVKYYKEMGYLPKAFINFLALLGWNPGNDEEIMSLDELVKKFDMHKVQKGGAIFNMEKLLWFNKEYLNRLSEKEKMAELASRLPKKFQDKAMLEKISRMIIERIHIWSDVDALVKNGELDYFFEMPKLDADMLVWKKGGTKEEAKENLAEASKLLESVQDDKFDGEGLQGIIMPLAEKRGKGNVLWPLRVALSGREKSPDPFTLLAIFGKHDSIQRIAAAINIL